MKKLICILLALVMLTGLLGCQGPELLSPGTFYYYRTDTAFSGTDGVLAPEIRELHGIEDDLDAILALYCQGPVTRGLENPIPKGCAVPTYTRSEDALLLHFPRQFADLSGMELTIAAGCLARTLLPLAGVRMLVLTADGALLDGETSMTVRLEDLGLRDDTQDRLHGDFTVYYADADRRYLVGQSISLFLAVRAELPMLLLEQLCQPSPDGSLPSVLPEGTRILSAVTEDGLCTVDLSREFVSRRFYSPSAQLLSIYGIVNTLTALPEIDRVELTVEGELLLRLGSVSLSGPMIRDDRFLGPVRTGLGEQDHTVYLTQGREPGLIPLPLRLRQSAAFSSAEQMVRYLLSDAGTNGLRTCIAPGTHLNSIRVERRICHVDFSSEFLKYPQDLTTSIRVLTASLCTLDDISAVNITIDGGVPEGYPASQFGVLVPKSDWFL